MTEVLVPYVGLHHFSIKCRRYFQASATLNDSMNDSIAMESQQIDIAISEKLIMKPSTIPSEVIHHEMNTWVGI